MEDSMYINYGPATMLETMDMYSTDGAVLSSVTNPDAEPGA